MAESEVSDQLTIIATGTIVIMQKSISVYIKQQVSNSPYPQLLETIILFSVSIFDYPGYLI